MNYYDQFEMGFGELEGKKSKDLKSPCGVGVNFYDWLIFVTDDNYSYNNSNNVIEINSVGGDIITYKDLTIHIVVSNEV